MTGVCIREWELTEKEQLLIFASTWWMKRRKSYEMVQQFAVPYSSVVSGVNYIGNNITFSSGMDHTYGEYDKDGKMICTYTYKASRYAYRVIKYDFTGVYYEKEQ